ncbi:MAG: YncE family protein [Planctomycetaceae bacterium]|nr:YncE family protein [Planctomycetaceae bacterium]
MKLPHAFAVGFALALAVVVAACGGSERRKPAVVEATSSRVDVFLRCSDPGARDVALSIRSVALRNAAGEQRTLAVEPGELRAAELARRTRIAGSIVAPDEYRTLVIQLDSAWLGSAGQHVPLEIDAGALDPGLEIPLNLALGRRDAASLFLEWRVSDSFPGGASFQPALALATEAPQTALGLLYVTDAGSSSVLALERATGQVVGTYKAGAAPAALVMTRDRRRLWIANEGDGSLSEVDVRQGSSQSVVPISFQAATCDIASADRDRWLVAANRELDTVTLLSSSGASVTHINVGRNPVRVASAPDLQRVFVANQGSDSLSVIDLASRAVSATVAVESRPVDVEVDPDGELAFVAHANSPNLLVLDAQTLATTVSIFVGSTATDVLADRSVPRVYIARARPAELVVVDLRMNAVIRRIPLSGVVSQMAQSRTGSRVYAAAPDSGAVLVIDVVLGKEEAVLGCGQRPTDVIVAD